MATYLWSALSANQVIVFDPLVDELIFDSGITSYTQLSNYDWTGTSSFYTDLSGKTVTFTGLGLYNMSPTNVQFQGSGARFLVGDQTSGTGGDDLANVITGGSGNDWIYGGGGDDTLTGGDGDDQIFAAGNGSGNDLVDGGNGSDWYSAGSSMSVGMSVNLMTGMAYAYNGEVDTLVNIENVRGTMQDDVLIGDNGDNVLRGRGGNDYLAGIGGTDWVTYLEGNATSGVQVDLTTGVALQDGFGTSDILSGIENVRGGLFDDFIQGNSDDNFLRGDAGNDTLIGVYGEDTLWGGLGDDFLQGGSEGVSGDYYYGGLITTASYTDAGGGVTVNLALTGAQNTVNAGTDTLVNIQNLWGSGFNDNLSGDNFNNSLFGRDGDDQLIGNDGNDYLSGGFGDDILLGGNGSDSLEGGDGNDLLNGGLGIDTAWYNNATSAVTVNLGLSSAQITGGAGTHTLLAIENLRGSAFNDKLTGNSSANNLQGGAGNDVLVGGAGNDTLVGGAGNDILSGGTGTGDIADYSDTASGVNVNLNVAVSQNTGGAGNDKLINIEGLNGSNFNDLLTGNAGDNTLKGGDGNDTLIGGAGDDLLDGGYQSDYVYNPVTDSYEFTPNNGDTVSYAGATGGVTVNLNFQYTAQDIGGGQGQDTLVNIESLIGSAYNDVLTTGWANSNSKIDAGSGNDRIVISDSSSSFSTQYPGGYVQNIVGGSGNDTLVLSDYLNNRNGMLLNLSVSTAQIYSTTYEYNGPDNTPVEQIQGGTLLISGIENAYGSDGNDHIIGTTGNNIIEGGLGDDTLEGGAGVDTLSYSNSENRYIPTVYDPVTYTNTTAGVTVSLAVSTAQNTGSQGIDTISGFENLIGSAGNDDLTGNSRNNKIDGGAGSDTLMGGNGRDTLIGGAGADVFVWRSNAEAGNGTNGDTVTDFTVGTDKIDLSAVDANASVAGLQGFTFIEAGAYTGSAGELRYTISGSNGLLMGDTNGDMVSDFQIKFTSAPTITRTDILGLPGGPGDDSMVGTTGNNVLEGNGGNDTLTGLAGDDLLMGGDGNDYLYGGEGDDTLIGGAGDDFLDGGYDYGTYDPVTGQTIYGEGNTASYASATGGVSVSLNLGDMAQAVGGGEGSDQLFNIQNLIGSAFDDSLRSASFSNTSKTSVDAGAGDDRVYAEAGSTFIDTFNPNGLQSILTGGTGSDTVVLADYFNNNQGISLDLGQTLSQQYAYTTQYTDILTGLPVTQTYGGSLTLSGFENAYGSGGNDHIIGTTGNNIIEGGLGDDTLEGGAGVDTLSYSNSENRYIPTVYDPVTYTYTTAGVTVSLAVSTAQNTGSQGIDTISGFENLIGSAGDDNLTGDSGSNIIEGGNGDDTMSGGAGFDTASYASASSGVTVSLAITGAQYTGGAGTDRLTAFEHLTGSDYDDILTGSNAAVGNKLQGGMGADVLAGGSGADQFVYTDITESAAGGAFDTITDFSAAQNDKINLQLIDANANLGGNQAFSFIGSTAFSAAGQVRFENGMVYANVDSDLGADLQIELTGVSSLTAGNFIL